MKKSYCLTKPLLQFVQLKPSVLLAASFLLPFTASAVPSDALLPDINAAITLTAPLDLKNLDMSEAVKRAVEWNPIVTGAVERLNQQGEEVNFAKAAYYPQIKSGISTSYRDSDGRGEEALTITGSQMVYDFGKVSSNVEAAQYGVEKYQADTLRVIDQLARETAFAALEVERYQELVKIAGEQVLGVTELLRLSKKRSEMGASTRSDEIQAQSRREAALVVELQMVAQLNMWKRILQNLVGSTTPPAVLPGTPAELAQACSVDIESLSDVPAIMVAEAQRSEAMANIKSSNAQYYPSISVTAGMEHYLNERDRDIQNERNRRDRNDYTITVNFNADLYQGGATTARKRGAEYALRAADAAKDEALLSIASGLQEAITQASTYEQRLSILDSRVSSIIQTQSIYRQQYISLGTRSLLDLLNTEQEIHQARMEKNNTQQDLKRLQIDCSYNTASLRSVFALSSDTPAGSDQ